MAGWSGLRASGTAAGPSNFYFELLVGGGGVVSLQVLRLNLGMTVMIRTTTHRTVEHHITYNSTVCCYFDDCVDVCASRLLSTIVIIDASSLPTHG